jgi:type I restriction enzyme S subunit
MNNSVRHLPIKDLLIEIIDNRGKSVPTVENGFPLIATNCIKHSSIYPTFDKVRYVDEETMKNWFRAHLKPNDILFVNKGTPGRVCLVPDPVTFCAAQDMMGFRCNDKLISYKYLFAALRSHEIQKIIENNHVGLVIPHFRKQDLSSLLIPVKPRIEQDFIGDLYILLSEKIELNNRINAELEAMAKTLYDYWFVQFDFPDKNGKPYKTSGGKMVWNEELKREIPEGWDSIMIENCLFKESSIKKIPTAEILEKGKFPVIDQSTDFIAGFTNDKEAIIKTDEPRIIFGDHTRILKLINFDFARGADGTQVMLSNNKRMPQHLFFNTLVKIDLSNYGYARHYKFLKDISIILPDETVSKNFETAVSPFYKMIRENIFQNQKLTELRDWLLPMLMNGQVKVN